MSEQQAREPHNPEIVNSTSEPAIIFLSQEEDMRLPEFATPEKLREVYTKIVKLPHYPDACRAAAKSLSEIGLTPQIDGTFQPDIPDWWGYGYSLPHSWAEDGRGNIYELTGTQFNKLLREENKFPEGIVIVNPSHPLHRRYFEP